MPQGTILIGQGELDLAPSIGKNIVRLQDLTAALAVVYRNGVDLIPLTAGSDAVDRRAVYIDKNDGRLKNANNSINGGAERMVGIFFGGKVFLNGQVIDNYDTGGSLSRGSEYWIQADGSLSTQAPPTGQDRWGVRAGIAISNSAMLVSYHNTGIV